MVADDVVERIAHVVFYITLLSCIVRGIAGEPGEQVVFCQALHIEPVFEFEMKRLPACDKTLPIFAFAECLLSLLQQLFLFGIVVQQMPPVPHSPASEPTSPACCQFRRQLFANADMAASRVPA